MKKDKNKILKYRVTYLEMMKHPSYSYPNCPIKFTNIIKSNNVPYWYFISLYKSVGEEYEWTDMLKQKKEITENFLNNNPLTSKFKLLNYKKYITDKFSKRDLDLKKKLLIYDL